MGGKLIMNTLLSELYAEVKDYVAKVMDEYHYKMPQNFYDSIVDDIIICSAYEDGYWTQSDISLAYQRVVANKFGVEI